MKWVFFGLCKQMLGKNTVQTNTDVQTEIAKLEKHCLIAIRLAFPMIEIQSLFDLDVDEDGDVFGLIVSQDSLVYQFMIGKEEISPMLRRVGKKAEGRNA